MFYVFLALVAVSVVIVARRRLRAPLRGASKYGNGKPMATRIVRPYAIVEAYGSNGEALLPTIVYSEEQAEIAAERYLGLGACVTVQTPIGTWH